MKARLAYSNRVVSVTTRGINKNGDVLAFMRVKGVTVSGYLHRPQGPDPVFFARGKNDMLPYEQAA